MKLPEIKITYSKILDPIFICYTQNDPQWKDMNYQPWTPLPEKAVMAHVERYKEIWKKYGPAILEGIVTFFDVEFYENIIEVYIVNKNPRGFSNPLILSCNYTENVFIMKLTHELIHRLSEGNKFKLGMNMKLAPGLPYLTQSHVIVHAALKYIYLDILNRPDLLEQDINPPNGYTFHEYQDAWNIVEEKGYKNLIEQFKMLYNQYGIKSLSS